MRSQRSRRGGAAVVAGAGLNSTSASRFLDTNVLVYLFDRDAPAKAERSREILAATGNVISTQVLQEFYSAATKKLGVPSRDAREAMAEFVKACRVITVEVPIILKAAERSAAQRLSFWDALILEAAVTAGCRVVLSEDLQEQHRYEPGVQVENPFGEPGPARGGRKHRA